MKEITYTKEGSDAPVDVLQRNYGVCARGPFVDSVLPHLNRMTFRDEMSPDEDFGIERPSGLCASEYAGDI